MNKNAVATLILARLDQAEGWGVKAAHDSLLQYLRDNNTAWPLWDDYPRGRDIFTQRWR